MALTPDQALTLTPADFEQVQGYEKDIDSKLHASFNPVTRRFDYFLAKDKKPALKIVFELQRRYESARVLTHVETSVRGRAETRSEMNFWTFLDRNIRVILFGVLILALGAGLYGCHVTISGQSFGCGPSP